MALPEAGRRFHPIPRPQASGRDENRRFSLICRSSSTTFQYHLIQPAGVVGSLAWLRGLFSLGPLTGGAVFTPSRKRRPSFGGANRLITAYRRTPQPLYRGMQTFPFALFFSFFGGGGGSDTSKKKYAHLAQTDIRTTGSTAYIFISEVDLIAFASPPTPHHDSMDPRIQLVGDAQECT